ncbi:MAG: EamA family transporter [Clostridia bacterium]|nr:EamA family transporter [Clostridia bacterium]
MILYVVLGITALTVTCQDIFKKKFNQKSNTGVFSFGGMISFFAMLFFVAVNRDWSYSLSQLFYSFGFAVAYATATLFAVLAIKYGSLAKTTLIVSCSLLIPSFYGMIFLGEPVGVNLVIGTVLLVIALIMINYEKESSPTSLRWAIFAILAFLGNGMCSVVQRIAQNTFGGEGQNVFMIVALAMVTVMLFGMSFASKEERGERRRVLRVGCLWAALCGACNGLCNYLVLYLNPRLPASVMFPVISAGSVVLVFFYATAVQHEKFNLRQKIGYAIGIVSIVLLNL